jgi:TolA-binding protein
VRTVKTPEIHNRVVDHLYDDLPDAQREAFTADLESDEAAATEARAFGTLLKLYREESDELTPSVVATERLQREAERAHMSLWARLMGDLLPRVVLRPAVGFAMVAVLLIGGGVFYVLSQRPGASPGPDSSHKSASSAERTVASAPAPAALPRSGESRTVVAENAPSGTAGKRGYFNDDSAAGQDQDDRLRQAGAGGRSVVGAYQYKNKRGALATRKGLARDEAKLDGLRGRRSRRSAKAKKRAYFSVGSASKSKPTQAAPKPVTKSPAPPQAANAVRGVQKKPTDSEQANKDKTGKKLSPPALHNRARKNLAKGKVAVACSMFGSLVNNHRSYGRRADALLGWARCEMARGSYSRAAKLARRLISEYPKWKKTGLAMLTQINRSQTNAALRAQRVKRVRRKPSARRRAHPARRSTSGSSTTSN